MKLGVALSASALVLAAVSPLSPACAAGYSFTKLVDTNTKRPDGQGKFSFNFAVKPEIDGSTVVFRTTNGSTFDSVWAANASGGGFVKLVDLHTKVPGGTGTFTDVTVPFDKGPPLPSAGTVAFLGTDSQGQGLYTVPAAGGTVKRVANYNTPDPSGGGKFTSFGRDTFGGFSIDHGKVVFQARNATSFGIYSATASGGHLALLRDNLHRDGPSNNDQFYTPQISGLHVAYFGFTGLSTIYASGLTGPFTRWMDGNTALPGAPPPNPPTEFVDGTLRISGKMLAFVGFDFDGSPNTFRGVYALTSPFHPKKVVDSTAHLPGLTQPMDPANSLNGLALDQGSVVFQAQDTTGGHPNAGLYIANGHTITRIVGTGDKIGNFNIYTLDDNNGPGPRASSGGRVVFAACDFVLTSNGCAIFAATPN